MTSDYIHNEYAAKRPAPDRAPLPLIVDKRPDHDRYAFKKAGGLLDKNGFAHSLERDIARTRRGYSEGGVLAFISIENFTFLQDHYSHATCEACIQMIAQMLLQESRAMDAAGHLEDATFALLLPDAPIDKAVTRLQALAARLNKLEFIREGHHIEISTGIRLAAYGSQSRARDFISDDTAQQQEAHQPSSNI
ncbi:MAG: diguanylate cyclase [Alphaproteobacteria bacterium]